jgi:hypothetical protein
MSVYIRFYRFINCRTIYFQQRGTLNLQQRKNKIVRTPKGMLSPFYTRKFRRDNRRGDDISLPSKYQPHTRLRYYECVYKILSFDEF